jgi:hypothetical protein
MNLGPVCKSGALPALLALRFGFDQLRNNPDGLQYWKALGSAGMLCCRLVRGSQTTISNHAYGFAIDLTLLGHLDTRGDDKIQTGLFQIYPYLNAQRLFWGAGFDKEDAMHFEVSAEMFNDFRNNGTFAKGPGFHWQTLLATQTSPNPSCTWPDPSTASQAVVRLLQGLLNNINCDTPRSRTFLKSGTYDKSTKNALAIFQRSRGITGDTTFEKTWMALGFSAVPPEPNFGSSALSVPLKQFLGLTDTTDTWTTEADAALKTFQTNHGLAPGYFNVATLQAMVSTCPPRAP